MKNKKRSFAWLWVCIGLLVLTGIIQKLTPPVREKSGAEMFKSDIGFRF
jgi:hypothetical protein